MNKSEAKVVDLVDTFDIQEVPTDGNCFFYSVLGALSELGKVPKFFKEFGSTKNRAHALRLYLCYMMEQLFFSIEDPLKGVDKSPDIFKSVCEIYKSYRTEFLQHRKEFYELQPNVGKFGDLCANICKSRPLANTIMQQYMLIEEFTCVQSLHKKKLEAAAKKPNHYIQQEPVDSNILLREAIAESLFFYIHFHARDAIHVDLLVFGPLVAHLFGVQIEYCFIEDGVFHFASQPITPTEHDGTIHLVNHLPNFPHYEYLVKKRQKTPRVQLYEMEGVTVESFKKQISKPFQTQMVPENFAMEDLTHMITQNFFTFGNLVKEGTLPNSFILTGRDMGIPHNERRDFMAGQLVFEGTCSQTKNSYYTLRTSQLNIETKNSTLFSRPKESTCYQRIMRGLTFKVDSKLQALPLSAWIEATVTIYGLKKDSEKQVLSLKPKGDSMSSIFYISELKDLPNVFVLELNVV